MLMGSPCADGITGWEGTETLPDINPGMWGFTSMVFKNEGGVRTVEVTPEQLGCLGDYSGSYPTVPSMGRVWKELADVQHGWVVYRAELAKGGEESRNAINGDLYVYPRRYRVVFPGDTKPKESPDPLPDWML